MKALDPLRRELAASLSALRVRLAAAPPAETTVITIPRHGYGTTRIHVDSVHAATGAGFRTLHVDLNAPPAARAFLAEQEKERDDFFVLRLDELCSRQTARLLALELVDTPWVAFLDNNMEVAPGWLERLVAAGRETGAALVSPVLVTRGGEIHFSAGRIVRKPAGIHRPHYQEGGRTRTPLAAAKLRRLEIDFAESHCCLLRSEAARLPGVLDASLHNAQTLACAGIRLKRDHGRKLVLEPGAVAAIVPIAFGYDLPWLCLSYMDRATIDASYRALVSLLGPGPSNDLGPALGWHAHHFKYLLGTMTHDDRLTRTDLLAPEEIPAEIVGYDHPLPPDTEARIAEQVLPYVEATFPELLPRLAAWLH